MTEKKLKVGILGFGSLGQHLYDAITTDCNISARMEVAFVWNRSAEVLSRVPQEIRMSSADSLEGICSRQADIVVEVSHPSISKLLAVKVMQSGANFVVGSPTVFADLAVERAMREAACAGGGSLYVPVGALWGAADLHAMANRDALVAVTITMRKHPAMLNLNDPALEAIRQEMILEEKSATEKSALKERVLYEGPVRDLCPKAPNNVNTMACAAMASHTLGFDGTIGRLVADARLTTHEIEILALGKPNPSTGQQFRLNVTRSSPAPVGAVTSKATYGSFLESLLKSHGRGPGVHFV